MYTPTIHASATDSTPTFKRLTQLTTTASASAETEMTARFIRVILVVSTVGRDGHRP